MIFPLVGNVRVRHTVESMLASGKIPHAILIEGDSGLGKTTLANFICRAAVCEGQLPPCGECDGCRLFENSNHPDVTVVSPEEGKKSISVQSVREIISDSSVVPQKADRKVFLILGAEALTVQAQNALLKVLEEPPKSVLFILTASSSKALLETIASRCAILTLSPPDEQDAAAHIASKMPQRSIQEIISALRTEHGSIGAALERLKTGVTNESQNLAKEFLLVLQNGSQYDLLKLLFPLEKDRLKTFEFYDCLETVIVSEIRRCPSRTLIRRYERLYSKVCEHKRLLKANINLSLLLTSLAAETTER